MAKTKHEIINIVWNSGKDSLKRKFSKDEKMIKHFAYLCMDEMENPILTKEVKQ